MKVLLILLAILVSPVNRAEAKRNVPLWVRWEHYMEEAAWCGIMYDNETVNASNASNALEPDPDDLEMLACVIYCEAGADSISDDTRRMVGDVVLNRVEDSRFPDTIEGVLTQKRQYGRFYWTGIVWPQRADSDAESAAVDRAYRIARELLTGTHSGLYGEGYIWQSERRQSKDSIYQDGIWFGR